MSRFCQMEIDSWNLSERYFTCEQCCRSKLSEGVDAQGRRKEWTSRESDGRSVGHLAISGPSGDQVGIMKSHDCLIDITISV